MSTDDSLIKLTTEAIEKLDRAFSEFINLSQSDKYEKYDIGALGRSIGLIREFQNRIFDRRPDLIPPPPEDYVPDPPLTNAQTALVNELNETERKKIDKVLLSNACQYWRKVARVVGTAMMEFSDHIPGLPDIYYAQRIKQLVKEGRLESQGNLDYMRNSEVRLPSKGNE